jgi:hypothetical protein
MLSEPPSEKRSVVHSSALEVLARAFTFPVDRGAYSAGSSVDGPLLGSRLLSRFGSKSITPLNCSVGKRFSLNLHVPTFVYVVCARRVGAYAPVRVRVRACE